jgi:hypothetical protein
VCCENVDVCHLKCLILAESDWNVNVRLQFYHRLSKPEKLRDNISTKFMNAKRAIKRNKKLSCATGRPDGGFHPKPNNFVMLWRLDNFDIFTLAICYTYSVVIWCILWPFITFSQFLVHCIMKKPAALVAQLWAYVRQVDRVWHRLDNSSPMTPCSQLALAP